MINDFFSLRCAFFLAYALGRAGFGVREYAFRMATEAEEAAEPGAWGKVSRVGDEILRDARGRPIVVFFRRSLENIEDAVVTFSHEARHIKDYLAGVKTSAGEAPEQAGQKLLKRFMRRRARDGKCR